MLYNYKILKGVLEVEILKIENLSKVYGQDNTKVIALDNISLSINRGEFVAIVGASGSGKSTLLHIIAGLEKPTEGKIFIENTDLSKLGEEKMTIFRRRQIGFIYQFYNLVPILTVQENLELPLLLDHKQNQEKLKEIMKVLELEDKANFKPNQLSGGQQQKVAIGRALMMEPSIILADEPTGNLDSKNSKTIFSYLKYSNRKYHQTILMVTHNEQLALGADRIIKLEDGKIVFDKKMNER